MSITRCRLPQNPSRIINTKLHFCSYDIFRLLYVCRNLITACFLCLVFFLFLLHFTLISPLCMCVKQENSHSQIRVQFILAKVWKYLIRRGKMLMIEILNCIKNLCNLGLKKIDWYTSLIFCIIYPKFGNFLIF